MIALAESTHGRRTSATRGDQPDQLGTVDLVSPGSGQTVEDAVPLALCYQRYPCCRSAKSCCAPGHQFLIAIAADVVGSEQLLYLLPVVTTTAATAPTAIRSTATTLATAMAHVLRYHRLSLDVGRLTSAVPGPSADGHRREPTRLVGQDV